MQWTSVTSWRAWRKNGDDRGFDKKFIFFVAWNHMDHAAFSVRMRVMFRQVNPAGATTEQGLSMMGQDRNGNMITGGADPADSMPGGDIALDPKIQEAIGRSLRAHYDDLVSAPVPDRFLVLLAELEAKEQRDGG